ncbi:alpha/beta fold hydrolase [Streptomyces mirabilis]|uniref:alpha/beta fold hydrolase n=1 Tax=Streptomyces mirabilis TaxID=68239 RepID=UPI003661981E
MLVGSLSLNTKLVFADPLTTTLAPTRPRSVAAFTSVWAGAGSFAGFAYVDGEAITHAKSDFERDREMALRVFVHGVPETTVVWETLREGVEGPSVSLALPGFGNPLPSGFLPTKDQYASWLTGELKKVEGPIDLVGHDWGALLVLRMATAGDVRLRSWICDVGSVFHPDYVWHPWAATVITPGQGEYMLLRRRQSSPEEAVAMMLGGGVSARDASEVFAAHDEVMSRCILGLYRSAVPNVAADWGADGYAPTSAPGMILLPTGDQLDDGALSREVAGWLGARTEVLDGLSHWWMYDQTGKAASVLEKFWAALE